METVQLLSGAVVPISSIRVGDTILAADQYGRPKYSEVIAVPHTNVHAAEEQQRADLATRDAFVRISLASGKDVRATPGHVIPVLEHCNRDLPMTLLGAQEVQTGMCVLSVGEDMKSEVDAVVSVQTVTGHGLYTVITYEEMIVVNGIVVSPYGSNPTGTHMFYSIYRLLLGYVDRTPPLRGPVDGTWTDTFLWLLSRVCAYTTRPILRTQLMQESLRVLGDAYVSWNDLLFIIPSMLL
jgi:hypothetical protein